MNSPLLLLMHQEAARAQEVLASEPEMCLGAQNNTPG